MALETGLIKRQIRRVWGFIASPVALKNKMMGFNEGDNGSGSDRTQMVAKGTTGIEHIFITIDEIKDYVSNEISGTIISSDIYVKVTSLTELTTALSDPNSFTIYCDSGLNSGLVITADNTSGLIVNGKKTIIGAGGTSFSFQGTGLFVTSIFIDVQTNSELNILDKMDFVSHGDSVTISNIGDGILRMSEIRSDVDAVSLYVTHGIPSPGIVDPSKCLLEINNFNIQPNDIGTKMSFDLWSGKHLNFKNYKMEIFTNISSNYLISDTNNDTTRYGQAVSIYGAAQVNGDCIHQLRFYYDSELEGTTDLKTYLYFNVNKTGNIISGTFSNKNVFGGLVESLKLHSDQISGKGIAESTNIIGTEIVSTGSASGEVKSNIYKSFDNSGPLNIYNQDNSSIAISLGLTNISLKISGFDKFGIDSDGNIFGKDIHDNAVLPTGSTKQYLASGTFTPTATLLAGSISITPHKAIWTRIGNIIRVEGAADIQGTSGNSISFRLSLPIISNISNTYDLSGGGNNAEGGASNDSFAISASSNEAFFEGYLAVLSNSKLRYWYAYEVL